MRGFARTGALCAILVLTLAPASHGASAKPTVWNIVALGDSDTTGEGDATALGWVGRYARLLRQKFGLKVVVTNLAEGGKTSSELLSQIRSDPSTRAAVKKAQIVLIGIGGADLNAGDARAEAGSCKAEACYAADLQAFGHNLDATATLVRKLRSSNDAVLRAITLPNVVPGAESIVPPFITHELAIYQNTTLRRHICSAMTGHQGRCVDAYRAFNGSDGDAERLREGLAHQRSMLLPEWKRSAAHGSTARHDRPLTTAMRLSAGKRVGEQLRASDASGKRGG